MHKNAWEKPLMRFFDAYNSPVQKAISFRPLHPAFHPAATGFPPCRTGIKKVSVFHREYGDKESKFQF